MTKRPCPSTAEVSDEPTAQAPLSSLPEAAEENAAEATGAVASAHTGLQPLVTVVVPCWNAETWLADCLASVCRQTHRPLEVSVWDDGCTDDSASVVEAHRKVLESAGVGLVLGRGEQNLGCGPAKNRAIRQGSGEYICFLDADDMMHPHRVERQLALAKSRGGDQNYLVGSNLDRDPPDGQPRHTAWLNGLSDEQLLLQRFCEATLSMVTWFCPRSLFDKLGWFSEAGRGYPEDLEFFYRHLRAGGVLAKVHEPLVVYRVHPGMESRSVTRESIWDMRVAALQQSLLDGLTSFSIWSAGRDGKRLYRCLSVANRQKVTAFLDIAAGKLAAGLYYDRELKAHVPIKPWKEASDREHQPAIICVKRGLHSGFEENLASLCLREGVDYWHFN